MAGALRARTCLTAAISPLATQAVMREEKVMALGRQGVLASMPQNSLWASCHSPCAQAGGEGGRGVP